MAALEPLGERLAVEQGHGQVVDAVDLIDGIDRAQIGVIERGRGPGLAIEPLQDRGAVLGAEMRDLEGHLAMYLWVVGLVDRAHAAAAEAAEDAESAELLGQVGGRNPGPVGRSRSGGGEGGHEGSRRFGSGDGLGGTGLIGQVRRPCLGSRGGWGGGESGREGLR